MVAALGTILHYALLDSETEYILSQSPDAILSKKLIEIMFT